MSWFLEARNKVYFGFRWLLTPFVRFFVRIGMPPWVLSTAGFLFTCVAFVLLYRWSLANQVLDWLRAAGGVILFAAAWDSLDGEVARRTGRTSARGAILDSVLDRVSEFVIFLGLFLFIRFSFLDSILLFALLFTSMSISYVRARAEGAGMECKVGVFDRPTRVFIIGLALIILPSYLNWVIRLLLVGTTATAARRFAYVLAKRRES